MKNNKTWAVGAMAAIAGTNAADAIVQITLTGNTATPASPTFTTDLTGDSVADFSFNATSIVNTANAQAIQVYFNGTTSLSAFASGNSAAAPAAQVGGSSTYPQTSFVGIDIGNGLIPITFTDVNFHGGATVQAWLDVRALAANSPQASVQLQRVIWDETNPGTRPANGPTLNALSGDFTVVPEPGSLALLALGAGGLLSRRRRAA